MNSGPVSLNWALVIVLSTLSVLSAGLIFYFVSFFLIPSLRLRRRLRLINNALLQLKSQATEDNRPVDPRIIRDRIMKVEPFKHLWSEYSDTLHEQYHVVDGQDKLVSLRATVPAEMFFNSQALVDTILRTEFFKHLPGLFTGIGIIGTFFGLIIGLKAFSVTENPDAVRNSLKDLLESVSGAFMGSAGAITIAMVVTFLEKTAVTHRYEQVEDLCRIIDSMYTFGVGEEYLARLVKASEESATQTTQLKDSLVADLKEMMTNLVNRQIHETKTSHQAMEAGIAQSITTSLREPMEAISRIVDRTNQNQGEAVRGALSDAIAGFMAKLEDVFGGQITGLNALMQETTASMRDTRDRFVELIANLSNAGRNAGEAMTEQLTRAMEAAEVRQREMNNHMRHFVEEIREFLTQSQSTSSQKLNEALESMGGKVCQVIDSLSAQQTRAGQEASQRQEAITSQAQGAVSELGGTVNALIAQTSEAVQAMKDSVGAIRQITTESVEKMNAGAETLYNASSGFSKAGQGVAGVLERVSQVSEHLSATAVGLEAAAKTTQLAVGAYERTRSDLAAMMESLKDIIESAKREAGMSKELVRDLESAATKFNTIQKETDAYLGQVSGVLEETFAKFTEAMRQSLDRSRTEFDKSLAEAVGMLRGTIDDLDDGLVRLSPRK